MDTIVSTENSKRQKLFEVQNNVEIEDRISFLPEHILQYILSFLPTKYAVGTSVLSTRWKFLWTLVQNLDFFDELVFNTSSKSKNYSKRKRFFINFVERVFLLNDVSDIEKFSLKCKGCTAAQFDKWISTVVRRKVQELVLCISKSLPFMLPGCIFTCQSLRILKIEMEVSVNIPALICFPCLNYLHLGYRIIIFSEPLVQEVSISCPVLEEFVMIGCKWMKFKTVNITVPKLQRLTIQDWYHKGLFDCEIMVSAESLKSFRFRSDLSYAYSLCHLSSLVEAIIDIGALYTTPDDKIVNRVSALVRGICNARDIELTADSTVTLSLPVFSADLHSLSRMINFKVAQGFPTNGRKLIDLLCNTPNIEFMSFPNGIDLFGFTGHGRILGKTPRCFLPNLKLVDIGCFRGIREEQWFVKFLVKSVSVMDKLTIKLPRCDRWVVEQLEMIMKDSKCVLEFV